MTDKQIIIDGVDVSGCEYYCEQHCKQVVDEDGCYIFLCADDKDCHYKNWKSKEQECERLKDIIETKLEDANICDSALNYINEEYIYVKRQLDQLKAENVLLQMQIEERHKDILNKPPTKRSSCRGCTLPYTDKKLKQTLAEIKFWARELLKRTGQVVPNEIKQILQKISEVEE